jgi:hypothetical protein
MASVAVKSIHVVFAAGGVAMIVLSSMVTIRADEAEQKSIESTPPRTAPDAATGSKPVRTIIIPMGPAGQERIKSEQPPPDWLTGPVPTIIIPTDPPPQEHIEPAQPPNGLYEPKRVRTITIRTDEVERTPTEAEQKRAEARQKRIGSAQPPKPKRSPRHLAGQKTLGFGNSVCSYRLQFNPAKQSEDAVGSTARLLFNWEDFRAPFGAFPDQDTYSEFDFDEYQQQCTNAVSRLNETTFVPLSGIEAYRRSLIEEFKDTCEFETIKVRGFSSPAALRDYRPASSCTRFIDALEGRTDTRAFFREFVAESCKKNSSPARCVEELSAKDPHFLLLTFGWGNCANQYTSRNNADGAQRERMRTRLQTQFSRLFKVKTIFCED